MTFADRLYDALKPDIMKRLESLPMVDNRSDVAFTCRPVRYKCPDPDCNLVHVGLQLRIVKVTPDQVKAMDESDAPIRATGDEEAVAEACINAHRINEVFDVITAMGAFAHKMADLMVLVREIAKEEGH